MLPESEGGTDDIGNAIPLCFECHAEVHLYNNNHPRGRKYHTDELIKHKEQWLDICKTSPHILVDHRGPNDGGLLYSLITELEFNHIVSNVKGCLFEAYQFQSAISDGILSLLEESLRDTIMSTYAQIKLANQAMKDLEKLHPTEYAFKDAERSVRSKFSQADQHIMKSLEDLHKFMAKD
jgi:hypothetical protein